MDAKQWAVLARNPKYAWTALSGGNVRSGPVRLSFCELFKPKKFKDDEGSKARYGVTLLMPPGDQATALVDALKMVIADNFGAGAKVGAPSNGKVRVDYLKGGKPAAAMVKWPIFDQGDKTFDGYEPGSLAVAAYSSADSPPRVVDPRLQPITDPNKVYAGSYAFVTIRPYWPKGWDNPAIGLQAVQWIADGERFGGSGIAIDEAFNDVGDEFAGVSLESLM